jgi:putative peptidoglycan lipid II flippase
MKFLFRTFANLFLISISIRIIDVLKNILIASKLGVSMQADVILTLSTLPDSLLVLLGLDSIRGIVNSEYSYEQSRNPASVQKSLSNLSVILFTTGFVITVPLLIFREQLISLLLPGFDSDRFALASTVSLLILPVFLYRPLQALVSSYYNSVNKYYFPVILQVIVSVFIICSIFLPYYQNELVFNIAIGFLAGNSIMMLLLIIPLLKHRESEFKLSIELDPLSKKIIKGCFTLFAVVVINQIYLYSRNFFVSYFSEGSVATLSYASSIPNLVSALTFNVVFGVFLNNLSNYNSLNKNEESSALLGTTINSLIFIYVPVVMTLLVFKINILKLIYMRGEFNEQGIIQTSMPFLWESLTLIPFVYFILFVAFMLAYKKYRIYSVIGVLVYSFGIAANYIFSSYFGFYGVSIGNLVVTVLMSVLLYYVAKGFLPGLIDKIKDSFKLISLGIIIFFIAMNFESIILAPIFPGNGIIPLLIGVTFIVVFYLSTTILLKIDYFSRLKGLFNK